MIDQTIHESRPSSTRPLIWLCACIAGCAIGAAWAVGEPRTVRSEIRFEAVFAPGMTASEMADADRMSVNPLGEDDSIEFNPGERWPGVIGEPVELTYSFLPDGAPTPDGPSVLDAVMTATVGPDWQDRFDQAISAWAALTGNSITLVKDDGVAFFIAPGGDSRGDIRIAAAPIDGGGGVLAVTAPPPNGDILLDSAENWGLGGTDLFLRNVVGRLIGVALGLESVCPIDGTKLMEPAINLNFEGPQLDDRLGIQWLYGDPMEPNDSLEDASPLTPLGLEPGALFELDLLSLRTELDIDLFRLDANQGDTLTTLRVEPLGLTYPVGPVDASVQCIYSLFDSLRQVDLTLELLDADGRVLAASDSGGLGESEEIQQFTLPSTGAFFIRVRGGTTVGSETPIQEYRLAVNVEAASGGADLNGDGVVDGADLASLLAAWGPCPPAGPCPADLNDDETVDGADLAALLAGWSG